MTILVGRFGTIIRGMPGIRTRFVRDVVEGFEREARPDAFEDALTRIGVRMSTGNVRAELAAASHADTLGVADAEELLFGLDTAFGDGSGRLVERFATEQFARVLAQGSFVVAGDLHGTVARMQAPIEHLFVALPFGFDLTKRRDGFQIFVGVSGRPRTARLLRHLCVGAIRASQRFAREGMTDDVAVQTEILGERAKIEVKLGTAAESESLLAKRPPKPVRARPDPKRDTSRPHLPTTRPTLEAVERILRRSVLPEPGPPEEIVAPRSRRPNIERVAEESSPPRTDTLPSLSQSGFLTKGDDEEPSSSSG